MSVSYGSGHTIVGTASESWLLQSKATVATVPYAPQVASPLRAISAGTYTGSLWAVFSVSGLQFVSCKSTSNMEHRNLAAHDWSRTTASPAPIQIQLTSWMHANFSHVLRLSLRYGGDLPGAIPQQSWWHVAAGDAGSNLAAVVRKLRSSQASHLQAIVD